MIADVILLAVILALILLGMRLGLLDMLGRLLIFLLSMGLSLLMLGPVTGYLADLPVLEKAAVWLTGPVTRSLRDTALSVSDTVQRFALPPLLESIMSRQLPEGNTLVTGALPELTAVLFRFALTAAVFLIFFTLIAFLVHRISHLLTRAADALPVLGVANRLGGVLAGLVLGLLIICMLLLLAALLAPFLPALAEEVGRSRIARYFYQINFLIGLAY